MRRTTFALLSLTIASPCFAPELHEHPRVRVAMAELEQARVGRMRTLAAWAPTIEVRANVGHRRLQDTISGIPEPARVETYPTPSYDVELALVQPLVKDALLWDELAVVDATVAMRELQLEKVVADITYEQTAIMVDVLGAMDRIRVAEAAMKSVNDALTTVRARKDSRDISKVDEQETLDRLGRWQSVLQDAYARRSVAEARWTQVWTGKSLDKSTLRDSVKASLRGLCNDALTCSDAARVVAWDVRLAKAQELVRQLEVVRLSRPRLPSVDFEVTRTRIVEDNERIQTDDTRGRIRARIPLPWGMEAQAERDSRLSAVSLARAQQEASLLAAQSGAIEAHTAAFQSDMQLKTLRARLKQAGDTLVSIEALQKAGKRDYKSVLDARDAVYAIELEIARVTQDAASARARLAYLTRR